MPIIPGAQLGPYEVVSVLGAGGMGEVYRARDTRLKREVAIKVLPAALARDPDRLARLQREAEVLATLNHPNIAAIYGFEETPDASGIVMELVEGPTLGDRIVQGAVPLDEALAITKQIADALDAAHEKGVIHRDLKPANIKVSQGGKVKVLDFGLAKMAEVDALESLVPVDVADIGRARNVRRADSRHGGLHESRAGTRQAGRSPLRYLVVRLRRLRDVDGPPGVRHR